ncbi:MAG: four helix bundle protein [Phycisphaerae bacterium]
MGNGKRPNGEQRAAPDTTSHPPLPQPDTPTTETAPIAVEPREQLRSRTKLLGLRVIRLVDALPKTTAAQIVARQVLRSALSVGANYRAACRARSRAEFIAKIGIVEEEVDETHYWLEILGESELMDEARLGSLLDETSELTAMVVASIRTARKGAR